MFRKTILSALVLASVAAPLAMTAGAAQAQQFYGHPWHHHHYGYGGPIAGGLAAGLVGGLIGGAIANSGPRYYAPPPPPPQCWYQRQAVHDRFDPGYHYENVRVCT